MSAEVAPKELTSINKTEKIAEPYNTIHTFCKIVFHEPSALSPLSLLVPIVPFTLCVAALALAIQIDVADPFKPS